MFWGIYLYDRELIHSRSLDKYIPPFLNHLLHTAILPCALMELYHHHLYLSRLKALLCILVYFGVYLLWLLWIYFVAGIWPYKLFYSIPIPVLPLFFALCLTIYMGFYIFGEMLTNHRKKNVIILSLCLMCTVIVFLK